MYSSCLKILLSLWRCFFYFYFVVKNRPCLIMFNATDRLFLQLQFKKMQNNSNQIQIRCPQYWSCSGLHGQRVASTPDKTFCTLSHMYSYRGRFVWSKAAFAETVKFTSGSVWTHLCKDLDPCSLWLSMNQAMNQSMNVPHNWLHLPSNWVTIEWKFQAACCNWVTTNLFTNMRSGALSWGP